MAMESIVRSGVVAVSAARRRSALVRVRRAWKSLTTSLGQRWCGSVWPLPGVAALSGNMLVAVYIVSPRMFCMYAARESIDSLPPSSVSVGTLAYGVSEGLRRCCRIAVAFVIASEVGECESISTWDFHAARVCGAIGYLNVGTLGVLAVLAVGFAGGMRRGSEIFPWTTLWSRNDVPIVRVGSLCVAGPLGPTW